MIREMLEKDIDTVVQLEKQIFSLPWTKEQYQYELKENPFAHLIVYEHEGEIVGYCDWWILYDQAQIANIAVKPSMKRCGIGQTLLQHMIEHAIQSDCETMSLEVRVSNTAAIALYEKNEFIKVNIRKAYYEDNHEDAYLMIKAIGGLSDDENFSD